MRRATRWYGSRGARLAIAISFAVACAPPVTVGRLDGGLPKRRPVAADSVRVFFDQASVTGAYDRIALLSTHTRWDKADPLTIVTALKTEAGRIGANAVILAPIDDPKGGRRLAALILPGVGEIAGSAIAIYLDPSDSATKSMGVTTATTTSGCPTAAGADGAPSTTPAGTVVGPPGGTVVARDERVRDPRVALREICAMMDSSARAWNRGQLDAFVSDYMEGEGTTYIGSRGIVRGPAAIREVYAPRFAPGGVRDSLSFERVEVDLLAPDLANTIAWYVLMRGDSVTARGPTSLVMRRVRGAWKIVHDHSS